MTLTAIKGQRGEEQAFCTCDDCDAEITISARHGRSGRQISGGKFRLHLHSEAAVIEGLRKQGWSHIKNRLRCPKCEAARAEKNPQQETAMTVTKIAPVRQMTQDMRLDIMEALFSAYDRKAKRYSGRETDKTVAEAVGNGCMPGWVAQVRDENFGPAGNAEVEEIRAAIEALRTDTAQKLEALTKRLDACVADHDRRVRA